MEIIKGEGAITKLYEAMSGFAPRFCSIAVDFCDEKCADEVRRELSRWYNLVSVGDDIKEEDAIRAVVSVGKTKKAVALANKYSLPLVTVVTSPDCVSAF